MPKPRAVSLARSLPQTSDECLSFRTTVEGQLSELRNEISIVKGELSNINRQISDMKAISDDVANIKSELPDITSISAEMSSIKGEMAHKVQVEAMQDALLQLQNQLQELKSDMGTKLDPNAICPSESKRTREVKCDQEQRRCNHALSKIYQRHFASAPASNLCTLSQLEDKAFKKSFDLQKSFNHVSNQSVRDSLLHAWQQTDQECSPAATSTAVTYLWESLARADRFRRNPATRARHLRRANRHSRRARKIKRRWFPFSSAHKATLRRRSLESKFSEQQLSDLAKVVQDPSIHSDESDGEGDLAGKLCVRRVCGRSAALASMLHQVDECCWTSVRAKPSRPRQVVSSANDPWINTQLPTWCLDEDQLREAGRNMRVGVS